MSILVVISTFYRTEKIMLEIHYCGFMITDILFICIFI